MAIEVRIPEEVQGLGKEIHGYVELLLAGSRIRLTGSSEGQSADYVHASKRVSGHPGIAVSALFWFGGTGGHGATRRLPTYSESR